MSADQEQRVRAALRSYLDAVPVSPPPAAALRHRAGGRVRVAAGGGRRWLAPALAGLTVAAVLGLTALFGAAPAPVAVDPAGGADRPVLPAHLHGGSWRTALVTDAPPGAAIAIFTHATRRTIGQPVVVAADGRTYRGVDGGDYAQLSGASFAALLPSPDGTRLAGIAGQVLDLNTGQREWHRLLARDTERAHAASPPLAWSPDGRWLAFALAASDLPRPPGSGGEGSGLALLDLDTGEVSFVDTGAQLYQQVAFSPGGGEFAVAVAGESAGGQPRTIVAVFNLDGHLVRELPPLPGGLTGWHGTAWSPDGALLAVPWQGRDGRAWFGFLDPTGAGAPVPEPFSIDHADPVDLLGWRGPARLLLGVHDGEVGLRWLVEQPVAGGGSRPARERLVSQFAVGGDERIGHLRLASGLLAEAEVRQTGRPRRGPLPWPQRLALAAAGVAGIGAAGLAGLGWWHSRRSARSAAGAGRRPAPQADRG